VIGLQVHEAKLQHALKLANDVVKTRGMAYIDGIWILTGEKVSLAKLFNRILDEVANENVPAYRVAIPVKRRNNRIVLLVDTCNFLDVKDVVKVTKWLKSVMVTIGLGLRYRPEMFDMFGIRDYIYIHPLRGTLNACIALMHVVAYIKKPCYKL